MVCSLQITRAVTWGLRGFHFMRLVTKGFVFSWLVSVSMAAQIDEATVTSRGLKSPAELKKLSLEELLNLEVVSASRKEENVVDTAAAVFVITSEDIRRSGFVTIPDLLRLSPGMDVAQLNAHTWAVSARGFNDVFANKLLVLRDGRSLYTPLFSGVF